MIEESQIDSVTFNIGTGLSVAVYKSMDGSYHAILRKQDEVGSFSTISSGKGKTLASAANDLAAKMRSLMLNLDSGVGVLERMSK